MIITLGLWEASRTRTFAVLSSIWDSIAAATMLESSAFVSTTVLMQKVFVSGSVN